MKPSVVFMGSPEFAREVLQSLIDHYPVVGVVTQPDRPAGRGQVLTPPPVKVLAQQAGIPVIQPEKLREPTAWEQLQAWAPDLIIVAAFGQILRQNVLDLPRYGCINVHASLLPRWRGAAPIQAAILHGDVQTGVTIMRMDAGLDTGPMLSCRAVSIIGTDTAGTLTDKLARLGAELLLETLPGYLAGDIQPEPQDSSQSTYAPMLKKEEGELDLRQSAVELARRVRAFNPWPGAYTTWQGQPLKVHRAHAVEDDRAFPGQRGSVAGLPALGAAGGWLALDELQPAGKKPMPGKVFLNGARGWLEEGGEK